MSCQFCEKKKNLDYLLSRHAHFCLFCGDSLHGNLIPTRDRANAGVSKMYKNAKTNAKGQRICPECGAVVTRSDPRAVYCSIDCQSRFNSRKQRERKKNRGKEND